ncbi:hypothetical protein CLV46_0360 [Diaminobutyricimonas aerilata]|uniref:CAAX prenyl protease 2/Lysostaphin resistance protein A-like domain-containing protein n=1 Tax=Diaminobutyricimonas aerilata TaxID=1162967 RepID=A0A2M9CFX2_9MICO|nr:type II CAAX endopeptidase family protein [Diaminobutyricimonas aerilata]PJJ70831.1 hypothetical protein CLV46_0360 [Diaminobutyricimonas aerilata]
MTPHRDPPRRASAVLARAAIVVLVFLLGLAVIVALTRNEPAAAHSTLVTRILVGIVVSALVLGTVVGLSRHDRRPLSDAGMSGTVGWLRGVGGGALAWIVPAAVAVAVIGVPAGAPLPPAEAWGTVPLVLAAVLLSEALPEEVAFRGYAQGILEPRVGRWGAILAQAAAFTATGVGVRLATGPVTTTDAVVFAGMGIGLGYLRAVTGNIAVAVGFHAAFQTGAQLVLAHGLLGATVDHRLAMLALGPIPFAVGIAALVTLHSRRAGRARPHG